MAHSTTATPTGAGAAPDVGRAPDRGPDGDAVLRLRDVSVRYGARWAVRDVTLDIARHAITAVIGPSGCGKSTLLRSLNRMNDLVRGAVVEGSVVLNGEDIYAEDIEAAEVRRRIGRSSRSRTRSVAACTRTSPSVPDSAGCAAASTTSSRPPSGGLRCGTR